jgi:hypothetical protein
MLVNQPQNFKTHMALTFLSTLTAVMIAVPVAVYVTSTFVKSHNNISNTQYAQLSQAIAATTAAKTPIATPSTTNCSAPQAAATPKPETNKIAYKPAPVLPKAAPVAPSTTVNNQTNNYYETHNHNHNKIINNNTINTFINVTGNQEPTTIDLTDTIINTDADLPHDHNHTTNVNVPEDANHLAAVTEPVTPPQTGAAPPAPAKESIVPKQSEPATVLDPKTTPVTASTNT